MCTSPPEAWATSQSGIRAFKCTIPAIYRTQNDQIVVYRPASHPVITVWHSQHNRIDRYSPGVGAVMMMMMTMMMMVVVVAMMMIVVVLMVVVMVMMIMQLPR